MRERPPTGSTPSSAGPADDRLDSWKEIAAYLRRDVTTVQRWEKREGMPVHRHLHDKMGSVYAFRRELDAWSERRRAGVPADPDTRPDVSDALVSSEAPATARVSGRPRAGITWIVLAAGTVLLAVGAIALLDRADAFWKSPIADARVVRVTDFEGTEQAAAISRDGQFVAFLSDRDGRFDVWLTRLGTGQFYNLT